MLTPALICCSSIFFKNEAGLKHIQYNFTNFWLLLLREGLAMELKTDGEPCHSIGFLCQGSWYRYFCSFNFTAVLGIVTFTLLFSSVVSVQGIVGVAPHKLFFTISLQPLIFGRKNKSKNEHPGVLGVFGLGFFFEDIFKFLLSCDFRHSY